MEELQFIQRLRFAIKGLPLTAVRDSYLFVQKGRGATSDFGAILKDYRAVRESLGQDSVGHQCKVVLEETQARCVAERRQTISKHGELWAHWGDEVLSDYKTIAEPTEDELKQNVRLKQKFTKWSEGKSSHIADMVTAECEERGTGVADELTVLEMQGWKVHRRAHAVDVMNTLISTFGNEKVASDLLLKRFPPTTSKPKRKRDDKDDSTDGQTLSGSILGKDKKLNGHIKHLSRLVLWMEWVYKDLNPEETGTFWTNATGIGRYVSCSVLKNKSFFLCMDDVFMKLLCPAELPAQALDYLPGGGGSTPFFGGLALIPTPELCRALGDRRGQRRHQERQIAVTGEPSNCHR